MSWSSFKIGFSDRREIDGHLDKRVNYTGKEYRDQGRDPFITVSKDGHYFITGNLEIIEYEKS